MTDQTESWILQGVTLGQSDSGPVPQLPVTVAYASQGEYTVCIPGVIGVQQRPPLACRVMVRDWATGWHAAHKVSPAVRDVWQWVITANDGGGADVDDLIGILNRHGMTCPEDLDDDA